LRRQHGIEALRRRVQSHHYARSGRLGAPDLVPQGVSKRRRQIALVGDVTFISTRAGWWYLAMLMDLCSRRIVGLAGFGAQTTCSLVRGALAMALAQRRRRQPDPPTDSGCALHQ